MNTDVEKAIMEYIDRMEHEKPELFRGIDADLLRQWLADVLDDVDADDVPPPPLN